MNDQFLEADWESLRSALRAHERDQLSDSETDQLLKSIAWFGERNLPTVRMYCQSVPPSEYSNLRIIYKALSEHSTSCDAFLVEEVKRVVSQSRDGQFDSEYLDVLSDIGTMEMYDNNRALYIELVDYLADQLEPLGTRKFTVAVLELMEWFLLDYDSDDKFPQVDKWQDRLEGLKSSQYPDVQEAAEEALEELEEMSARGLTWGIIVLFARITAGLWFALKKLNECRLYLTETDRRLL